jgi:hypothetical protein
MALKDLATKWSLPDRSQERKSFTLRLNYDQYARLLALKETFNNRSLNDILNDIIEGGLDEIISSLPSRPLTIDEKIEAAEMEGGHPNDYDGCMTGSGVSFKHHYSRILREKPEQDSQNDEQQPEHEAA